MVHYRVLLDRGAGSARSSGWCTRPLVWRIGIGEGIILCHLIMLRLGL